MTEIPFSPCARKDPREKRRKKRKLDDSKESLIWKPLRDPTAWVQQILAEDPGSANEKIQMRLDVIDAEEARIKTLLECVLLSACLVDQNTDAPCRLLDQERQFLTESQSTNLVVSDEPVRKKQRVVRRCE